MKLCATTLNFSMLTDTNMVMVHNFEVMLYKLNLLESVILEMVRRTRSLNCMIVNEQFVVA